MKKILIVEDELIVRSIYRRKFEISGYQVETAGEGAAALALVPTFKPDAVQVDINMPGIDGVEVIRQIRNWPEFQSVPILVVSSFYRPDLAKEAWKAGATKCVSKMDCTPNLALELVEQMLSGEYTPSPFSKLAMTGGRDEGIRVIPAETPWSEATQMYSRKAPVEEKIGAPAMAAPPPTPKAPTTLPTFGRAAEPAAPAAAAPSAAATPSTIEAPKGPTMPHFGRASTGNTMQIVKGPESQTGRFRKPDPEGSKLTTRPGFSTPAAQQLISPIGGSGTVPPFAAKPGTESAPAAGEAIAALAQAGATVPAGGGTEFRLEIRQEFLKRAPELQSELRDRVGKLVKSKSPTEQLALLGELARSVSSLASLSGITGFSRISHMADALDALIKDLQKKPQQMTNSVLRTVAHATDCLNGLFRELEQTPRDVPQSMLILAVDDEPIARRTISVALGKANLRCVTLEDSQAALAMLKENTFDLIFLDAEMPGLNGFQLCTELRKLPSNKSTPVIFVTSLTKFEARAQSTLAGANDLIAKPFLMMELAVKALTYLLRPPSITDSKPANN